MLRNTSNFMADISIERIDWYIRVMHFIPTETDHKSSKYSSLAWAFRVPKSEYFVKTRWIPRPQKHWWLAIMMSSSNGNIFRVTGPLCGEFTCPRWFQPAAPTECREIFEIEKNNTKYIFTYPNRDTSVRV